MTLHFFCEQIEVSLDHFLDEIERKNCTKTKIWKGIFVTSDSCSKIRGRYFRQRIFLGDVADILGI